mmetsp:Transcript_17178/g.42848  ORF Transcript_17178/g.42848 Transcript_17178/m.42848 type:complete len:162 (-) Transcript_17178:730-1215(-)|eukprot:CAMPEP_0113867066 /NCGR_PEP_ID=MMETSP0780_2-20120614/216_1 /TAXON_ID=652834 /ORGANISM="Palpitomonas bilix" /LENGTH=161 /DNA_ID=CAMNT_0000851975 /DNA_START=51 /DNA_END=536 /DNA_ORIENTATION=+ /assembly_acc=CAM_ASM_000599
MSVRMPSTPMEGRQLAFTPRHTARKTFGQDGFPSTSRRAALGDITNSRARVPASQREQALRQSGLRSPSGVKNEGVVQALSFSSKRVETDDVETAFNTHLSDVQAFDYDLTYGGLVSAKKKMEQTVDKVHLSTIEEPQLDIGLELDLDEFELEVGEIEIED